MNQNQLLKFMMHDLIQHDKFISNIFFYDTPRRSVDSALYRVGRATRTVRGLLIYAKNNSW